MMNALRPYTNNNVKKTITFDEIEAAKHINEQFHDLVTSLVNYYGSVSVAKKILQSSYRARVRTRNRHEPNHRYSSSDSVENDEPEKSKRINKILKPCRVLLKKIKISPFKSMNTDGEISLNESTSNTSDEEKELLERIKNGKIKSKRRNSVTNKTFTKPIHSKNKSRFAQSKNSSSSSSTSSSSNSSSSTLKSSKTSSSSYDSTDSSSSSSSTSSSEESSWKSLKMFKRKKKCIIDSEISSDEIAPSPKKDTHNYERKRLF